MNTHLFLLLLSVLSSFGLSAQTSALRQPIYTPECQQWVDSVMNTLSETDRISQLIMMNTSSNQGDKSRANIQTLVGKYKIGGIFLSKGTSAQFAEMTNYAQSITKVPLMVAIDGEWGVAMRVTDAPVFPYNMNLGAIQDPTLLYRYGEEVANECRALGIQIDFAPDLDVNCNPSNPVIGHRSFGEDPQRVAVLGRAYSLGLEAGGVMSVAKHFPGHGDTNVDSHKALPVVTHSRSMFDTVDLVPFKSYIAAGCSGVMVGHLDVPALDGSHTPASLSNKITTGLLKNELGFDGLVFTDALAMKGAANSQNPCLVAFKAGADILLNPPSAADGINAIKRAIEHGDIQQADVDQRCRKVLMYKYALGLSHVTPINTKGLTARLNNPKALALIQQLADASITAVSNDGILPIGNLAHTSIALVNIGAANNQFVEYCQKYAKCDVYTSAEGALTAKQIADIDKHDVVIAAVYKDSQAAVTSLGHLKGHKGLVTTFMINPYKVGKFASCLTSAQAIIMAYETSPQLCQAAAMALFGGINVTGRLPVNVEGVAKMGSGVDIRKSRLGYSLPATKGMKDDMALRLDSAVNKALASGAFPGAQLIVVKDGDVVIDRSYGNITKGGAKVTDATLFDLASVSKTVGTLPGVMKAYDLGLFDLDAPAHTYIPGLNVDGKREITPRMLLHHETGMPASLNMYKTMMDSATYTGNIVTNKRDRNHTIAITGGGYGHSTAKMRTDITSRTRSASTPYEAAKGIFVGPAAYDTIMANIYRADIKPARKYVYSCLNFCLLMDLEQRLTKQPHQQWVTDSIWAPIGAHTFCYRPTEVYFPERIAFTENDTYLRKQHIHGYVHDELAAFSGGVQGNAGVFGTATDIAKLCQMWLNGGTYGDVRVLSEDTSTLFTTEKSETCRRGLGFDKPDVDNHENSPCCDEASPSVYGHTGFTGTCFWVDPDEDLIFIFLCNRVDPTRSNKAFTASSIRPTLMSIVYQSLASSQK